METNPTAPFQGKRRPAAGKRDGDRARPSAQPAPPPARPRRAFGTARSTNVPVEKPPPPTKPGKPLTKPSRNGIKKPGSVVTVTTQSKGDQEERTPTPMPSEETPYRTAENCSKCRFDKLETSAYWLAQIKIAESASNHLVAAAFFRLASDCHAQPFCSLQRELKHYVARHGSVASESQWSDLCAVYGLPNGVLVEQGGSEPDRLVDEFDIIDIEKETTELIAASLAITEEFVDVNAMASPPKDSPFECNRSRGEKCRPLSSNRSSLSNGPRPARGAATGAKVGRSGQMQSRGKEGKLE